MSSVIGFIALIAILVTIQEYGHLWMAKKCGVKVEAFSVGFGPVIMRKIGTDGVDYRLSAIPLGGYVKMKDEISVEDSNQAIDADSFFAQTWWEKALIAFAGPAANFILTIVLFAVLAALPRNGVPPVIGKVTDARLNVGDQLVAIDDRSIGFLGHRGEFLINRCIDEAPMNLRFATATGETEVEVTPRAQDCLDQSINGIWQSLGIEWQLGNRVNVTAKFPAAQAGLKSGDRIIAVNGIPTPDWKDIFDQLSNSDVGSIRVEVDRDGSQFEFDITPTVVEEGEQTRRVIGVSWAGGTYRSSLSEAIVEGFERTWQTIKLTPKYIAKMFERGEVNKTVGGPIAIGKAAGSAVDAGLKAFVEITAMLSLSLGLINLLPIPILDGGRIVQHVVEGVVLRRPMSDAMTHRLQQIGLFLVLALMVFAIYNDVAAL